MVSGFAIMIGAKRRGIQLIILAILLIAGPRFVAFNWPSDGSPNGAISIDPCVLERAPLAGEGWSMTPSYGYFDPAYLAEESRQHLGIDLPAAAGTPILSPAKMVVLLNRTNSVDIMQSVLILRDTQRGIDHVFGHISSQLSVGAEVEPGEQVGEIRNWSGNSHVHWGVNLVSAQSAQGPSSQGAWGWGRAPAPARPDDASTRGWVDPSALIASCH